MKVTQQTCVPENSRSRGWEAERRVSRAQTLERGPPSALAEIQQVKETDLILTYLIELWFSIKLVY